MTARLKKSSIISNEQIQDKDVIIGLCSYGKASYETEYNGGMGSNGLTSARHDVFSKIYATKYPECYDPQTPIDLVYSGSKLLTDQIENSPLDAGKLVLSPTRTYAPIVHKMIQTVGTSNIHGMIHCSGGAQTKILHYIDKLHIIKNNLFPIPPLFKLIQEESHTDWKEMYQVFNCGHRLELYVNEKFADELIAIAKSFQVDAQVIGYVEYAEQKQVTIQSEYGNFVY